MTRSRLPTRKLWLYGYGCACALTTAALLVLPVSTPGRAEAPEAERYAGADHRLRTTAPSAAALPIRFASAEADPATGAAPSALPALIGIAGGSVWLKSATTGEVERVAAGAELDGWRVAAVKARSATLARGEERQTLELYRVPSSQGVARAAPSAPNGLVAPTPPPLLSTPPQSPSGIRP